MIQKLRSHESHTQVTTVAEFDREARKLAGLPEYAMDDPERPFTEEYDPPKGDTEPPAEVTEPVTAPETEPEDTSPSADAREMYKPMTAAQRRAIQLERIRKENINPARLALQAGQKKFEHIKL